jgi:glycolate dehydrogenase FAD-binding subunit
VTTFVPGTVEELAEVVRGCAAAGTPLRPKGSGYEIDAGNPVQADVVVETAALASIRQFDPDELVIRVGAGVTVAALHAELSDHGLRAIVPGAPGSRTVGGVIATATSGFERLKYGPVRNHVIGITLVAGSGDVVRAGGQVVKNVTGFDLSRLCVGSFGRLGVIADVGLRVFPRRGSVAVVEVDDPEAAWRGQARPLAVVSTRLHSVAVVEGSDAAIDAQATRLGGRRVDESSLPSAERWAWRATVRSRPAEQPRLLEAIPAHWSYIAQHGVGLSEVGGEGAVTLDDLVAARESVESVGGRLVMHHIPDELRGSIDAWGQAPTDIEIQRRIVERFDPNRIFNPGILPEGL